HDIVATTLDAAATLPFRFGTVVAAADLDAWLDAHAPLIRATLGQLRGCVEMSVKLLRLHCGHSIERTCRECADGAPGVVQLRELAELLVTQAGVERWRYRSPAGGGNVAGAVAFLVPRSEVDAFLTRIAPIASRAPGIAVVPTGPWPPYSFVPVFDRFPLASFASPGSRPGRRACLPPSCCPQQCGIGLAPLVTRLAERRERGASSWRGGPVAKTPAFRRREPDGRALRHDAGGGPRGVRGLRQWVAHGRGLHSGRRRR